MKSDFFSVERPDNFRPHAGFFNNDGNGYCNCHLNDKKKSTYVKIHLEKKVSDKCFEKNMFISFSCQNILFKNNLDELEEYDFDLVITRLLDELKILGIETTWESIKNSEVTEIDISKNFIIKNYDCLSVLSNMKKVDINYMDSMERDYSNGGKSLYFRNGEHEICIYDKISQMKKYNIPEKLRKKYPNILRFEVRLKKVAKVRNILNMSKVKFGDVFKKSVWKYVIELYMGKIISDKNLFLFEEFDANEKALRILTLKKDITLDDLIYTIGVNVLCKDQDGLKTFLNTIESYYHDYKIKELKKFLFFFSDFNNITYQYNFIKDIKKQLKEFKSLRLINVESNTNRRTRSRKETKEKECVDSTKDTNDINNIKTKEHTESKKNTNGIERKKIINSNRRSEASKNGKKNIGGTKK